MSASTTELIGTPELAQTSGATFRQLDFWARRGYLVPAVEAKGSGTKRRYTLDAINRARVMASFSRLFTSNPPSELLELIGTTDPPWLLRNDSIRITIEQVVFDAVSPLDR